MSYSFSYDTAGEGTAYGACGSAAERYPRSPSTLPDFSAGRHPAVPAVPGLRSVQRSNRSQPRHLIPVSYVVRTGSAITKIEAILESVVTSLLEGARELSLPFRCRPMRYRGRQEEQLAAYASQYDPVDSRRPGKLSYPGKNLAEAKKFSGFPLGWGCLTVLFLLLDSLISGFIAAVLKILELSRAALVSGNVITKRQGLP